MSYAWANEVFSPLKDLYFWCSDSLTRLLMEQWMFSDIWLTM